MATFRVKLRDLEKTPLNLPTDERHLIIITRDVAYRLEVADVHFNFDSAVFLPDAGAAQTDDPSITGLAVMGACLRYAEAHPEQLIVIAGHTDTVGTPGYNLTLSSLRAQNVQAALLGKRDDWVSSATAKHCVADYQRILQFTAKFLGWGNCDPQGVDNRGGPKTAQAVKNFQARYNDEFDASIDIDGGVGPQTWGAFFDVYMLELRTLLDTDDPGLLALQQGVTFVDPAHGAVGCGENHPIEAATVDQFRSATNRRVEILFFNPPDVPTFPCHPTPRTCQPAACQIYRLGHFKFEPLPVPADLHPVAVARPRSLSSYRRSFPKPSLIPTLHTLAARMTADPTLSALVMGHSDDTGDTDADYAASLARANAARALLSKDADFFRNKFTDDGSPDAWNWEEVQWMLAAIQDDSGSPLYGGRSDGHRGDRTLAATQVFKLLSGKPPPFHRRMDGETLAALVDAYLNLIGPNPIDGSRLTALGGGSWHDLREFGLGGGPLEGDPYASSEFPDYRRVEFFLFRERMRPGPNACPPQPHSQCAAYEAWCNQVVEIIDEPPDWDALVTVVDADSVPMAGVSVSVSDVTDGQIVGTFTTSSTGIAKVQVPRGVYVASAECDGEYCAGVLDLRVPDLHCGVTLRVARDVKWKLFPANESTDG